jgi:hypothetical protein
MSYTIRARDVLPSNRYGQYMWGFFSMLEDINVLLAASREASSEEARVTLFRYALVALSAFDELAKEFQGELDSPELDISDDQDRSRLEQAIARFHRSLQPFRHDLAAVRNTLGAHRGLPGARERKRFSKRFEAWGEWESTLTALEARCNRDHWEHALEAAFTLHGTINDLNLGSWFWTDGKRLHLHTPIRKLIRQGKPVRKGTRPRRENAKRKYEIKMLRVTMRGLDSEVFRGSSSSDVFLESFVIHVRNLIDFFWPPESYKSDDVLAEDFFNEPAAWLGVRPNPMPELLERSRVRAHKMVAHLTYPRILLTEEEPDWEVTKIALELEEIIRLFTEQAPPMVATILRGDEENPPPALPSGESPSTTALHRDVTASTASTTVVGTPSIGLTLPHRGRGVEKTPGESA